MRGISNRTGPIDYGEESGEIGSTSTASQNPRQELIFRANAVPIINIFRLYGIRLDAYNRRTTCPFKFHQNGQESTPSFWFYPETNSWHCFGCHTGSRASEFVMHMDGCDKVKAAVKILEIFNNEVDEDLLYEGQNVVERVEIMSEFSQSVLEFRQNNEGEHAFQFIEYMCWVYDQMNLNHANDNDALRGLNARLIDLIQSYDPNIRLTFEDKYLEFKQNQ